MRIFNRKQTSSTPPYWDPGCNWTIFFRSGTCVEWLNFMGQACWEFKTIPLKYLCLIRHTSSPEEQEIFKSSQRNQLTCMIANLPLVDAFLLALHKTQFHASITTNYLRWPFQSCCDAIPKISILTSVESVLYRSSQIWRSRLESLTTPLIVW